jgi:hypothetical protein
MSILQNEPSANGLNPVKASQSQSNRSPWKSSRQLGAIRANSDQKRKTSECSRIEVRFGARLKN